MVGDSQQLEALELQPMPINNTQEEQSLAQEVSMISNELQYELLSAGQEEQQQQSSHTSRWYSISRLPKSKRFYTTMILVLTISASALIFAGHYTKHREEHITYKEYVENIGSPEKLGYFNVYIRGSTDDDTEQVRLPAALFNRRQFPLDGPFTSFKPGTPVFIHQETQQTAIFLSNRRIYLLPKLYDTNERTLSLGELIARGSAGFDDKNFGMSVNTDLTNLFHSEPLDESDTPKFDPEIGSFTDGIYTNYRPSLVQKMAEVPAYDRYPSYEKEDGYYKGYSSYKTRNPYYRKPSSKKGRSSTTKSRGVKTSTRSSKVLLPEPPPGSCNITVSDTSFASLYLYASANSSTSVSAKYNRSSPLFGSSDYNATLNIRALFGLDGSLSAYFTYRDVTCPGFCYVLSADFYGAPFLLDGVTYVIGNFTSTITTSPRGCFNPFSTDVLGFPVLLATDALNVTGGSNFNLTNRGAVAGANITFSYSTTLTDIALANVFADLGILGSYAADVGLPSSAGGTLGISLDVTHTLTSNGGCGAPYNGYYCCCQPTFIEVVPPPQST